MSSSDARFPLIPVTVSPDLDFTDHAASFGVEMALIHNVIIRCLNSIHYNAPLVKQGDELGFVGYCLSWSHLLHDHHHGEENIIFPFLQSKFDMNENIEQHEAFTGGLNAFDEYLKSVSARKATYDGEKTRQLVEAFGDTLVTHLHDEVRLIPLFTQNNSLKMALRSRLCLQNVSASMTRSKCKP